MWTNGLQVSQWIAMSWNVSYIWQDPSRSQTLASHLKIVWSSINIDAVGKITPISLMLQSVTWRSHMFGRFLWVLSPSLIIDVFNWNLILLSPVKIEHPCNLTSVPFIWTLFPSTIISLISLVPISLLTGKQRAYNLRQINYRSNYYMLYLKRFDLQLITWQNKGDVDFRKSNFPFGRPQLEWSLFKIEQETLGRRKK